MTRYLAGVLAADTVVRKIGNFYGPNAAPLTLWDSFEGGTQHEDLSLDEAGTQLVSSVTSDAYGAWSVYLPEGVTYAWVDDGNPNTARTLVVAGMAVAEAVSASQAQASNAEAAALAANTAANDAQAAAEQAQAPTDDMVASLIPIESATSDALKTAFAGRTGPSVLIAKTSADVLARLNSLPASGGFVVLDEGDYTIDKQIDLGDRPNVHIVGQGSNTVLTAVDAFNQSVLTAGDPAIAVLTPGFSLASLVIDGNKDNQNVPGIVIGDEQQDGPYGVFARATDDLRLFDVEIRNCYDSGFRHQGVPSPGDYTRKVWMHMCNFHDNRNYGAELSQRFRQVSLVGVFADYNQGGGIYADHSEAQYNGITARYNGGYGIYIHNVQRCSYRGLHAYNNGKHGIYVEGLVESIGSDWFAHNNGADAFSNGSDIMFLATIPGYGITRKTTISNIWVGGAVNDSTSAPNEIGEDYGIFLQDGMEATDDLHLLDVHVGPTNVAPVRLPATGPMPSSFSLTSASRPAPKPGPALAEGEATMSRQQVNTGNVSPGSGGMRLMYFTPERYGTYSQLRIPCNSFASGMTLIRFALYEVANDGTLTEVANTPNDTTLFSSTISTKAFAAPVNVTGGQLYALGILQVGTTPAKLVGQTGVSAMNQENNKLPRASATLTGLSDLPASPVVDSDLTNQNDLIYAVLLP